MTASQDPKSKPTHALPAALSDVALTAAATCAATGDVSVSWWLEEVRTGRAPKPVIQQPRFTRWRVQDVRRFWAERATQAASDPATGVRMAARAKKASAAARKVRDAAREGVAP